MCFAAVVKCTNLVWLHLTRKHTHKHACMVCGSLATGACMVYGSLATGARMVYGSLATGACMVYSSLDSSLV